MKYNSQHVLPFKISVECLLKRNLLWMSQKWTISSQLKKGKFFNEFKNANKNFYSSLLVMDSGLETQSPDFGFWKCCEEMGQRASKLNKAFLPKVLQNFEKSSNMAKKHRMPCSTCLKPIFRLIPDTRNWDFGYPISITRHIVIILT